MPQTQGMGAAAGAPEPAPAPVDPALMTMNTLSGQDQGLIGGGADAASGSLADQAYAKLASMDTFTLSSKKDETAANPFASSMASTSISDNRSLADMQKTKVRFGLLSGIPCMSFDSSYFLSISNFV